MVGYQALETEASGNTLLAPTFLKVSESNTVTLADIKVSGYLPPHWEGTGKSAHNEDGCSGSMFVVQTLTPQGTKDKMYYWLDYMQNATTKVGPGWFASAGGTPIAGGEASVELDAGKALWISGSGLTLQPAGAVNPFDIEFKTVTSGNVAIGNCTPVDLTLNDLTVTGYKPPHWEGTGKSAKNEDGCSGSMFVVQTLTTQGTKDKMYYWLDYMQNASTRIGPGWFASAGGTHIEGGADKVEIPAGKALWITGSGLNLVIPAPELDGAEAAK